MQPIIYQNAAQLKALCTKHHVRQLHVFGSAVRDDFHEQSDIDFLVEFRPIGDVFEQVENREALNKALRKLFGRDVDLIQYEYLTNKYLKHFINQEKVLLYGEA